MVVQKKRNMLVKFSSDPYPTIKSMVHSIIVSSKSRVLLADVVEAVVARVEEGVLSDGSRRIPVSSALGNSSPSISTGVERLDQPGPVTKSVQFDQTTYMSS